MMAEERSADWDPILEGGRTSRHYWKDLWHHPGAVFEAIPGSLYLCLIR